MPRRSAIPVALTVTMALVMTWPAPAAAQGDALGVWFDPAFSDNDMRTGSLPFIGQAYLVLHEPTIAGVGGWECMVDVTGPVFLLQWRYEGQAVNFKTPPEFFVGLGSPLPHGEAVLLATVDFLVQEDGPVPWSLRPIAHPSLPGAMAYISFADPNVILPLGTVSGEPLVATINRTLPVVTVSPNPLEFGLQALGTVVSRSINLYNAGEVIAHLDVRLASECADFTVTTGGGRDDLYLRSSRIVTVAFTPSGLGPSSCTLLLGDDFPGVPLSGAGRAPHATGTISADSLYFGAILPEAATRRFVTIHSAGELPLHVDAVLPDGCAYRVRGETSFDVPAGGSRQLEFYFLPHATGQYRCEVALNDSLPLLVLQGTAVAGDLSLSVDRESIDFTETAIGESRSIPARFSTNAGLPCQVLVDLEDPDGAFRVAGVPYLLTVELRRPGFVPVFFEPTQEGRHEGRLRVGPVSVSLSGLGAQPAAACSVSVDTLDFGLVRPYALESRIFTVVNTGNSALEFLPTVDCPSFVVAACPTVLQPGAGGEVQVRFVPVADGPATCRLDLGPESCGGIVLTAIGLPLESPTAPNLIAVSFIANEWVPVVGVESGNQFDAYLMMLNPEAGDGVFGWELQLTHSPGLFLFGTELFGAGAVNALTSPGYRVALDVPLPPGATLVLARFEFLQLGSAGSWIGLRPLPSPSLPAGMSWAANAAGDLRPMLPATGAEIAAVIEGAGIVAVSAVPPLVVLDNGRIELRWPIPADGTGDGCHVYRRAAAGPVRRITAEPIEPLGSGFAFTDVVAGLAPGSNVAYSYGVMRGDVEIARSPETEIEIPTAASRQSRLLPNVPNPFNPETRIRWELESPGTCRVAIHDVTGRRLRVLHDGPGAAGANEATWFGRDDAGRPLASGTYYVRLETTTGVDTRKVMLVK